jgi:glycerol uptake facilitator-like aquaporin
LLRRGVAEALGTALLLAAVVGSGIMGERLAGGNTGIALLANSIATGAALYALIATFGPISGAHFNPAVTAVFAARGTLACSEAAIYIAAQLVGAVLGVWLAHLMFDLPIMQVSAHARTGPGQWTGELVATFGLIGVILGGVRHTPRAVPALVACYITAAYWFTSSTSFANPAVTVARALTDTFAGIDPRHVAGFVVTQLVGAGLAAAAMAWLLGAPAPAAARGTETPAADVERAGPSRER